MRKHRGLKRYYKNLSIENDLDKSTWLDLENHIDQLVYQLYELTEEEIKIIEGNG